MTSTFRIFVFACLFTAAGHAQQTTISQKTTPENAAAHRVMLIPFEQRLYMSEIDHHVHAETKMSARQIRNKFRDGINEQLYKSFKAARFSVLDLMDDTLKYKKDTELIYQNLSYDYLLIPDQNNYQPPKKEKEQKKISHGQLTVESDIEPRFMNAKLTSPKVIPSLHSKYKTDIFVFINELEIKAAGYKAPGALGEGSDKRRIIVHYTVYNHELREINSGIAESDFDPELNNPKKIVEKHFASIADLIVQRTNKALSAPKK